jgi:uncharacterized protein (TIGR00730 family)
MARDVRSVAVFGSSEPAPGDSLYEIARALGSLCARSGFTVVTGGYGGVMEGASRGAVEAGGRTIGIVCSVFEGRRPNRWLTETHETCDLFERTRELIDRTHGYVVLPGQTGTLAELAMLWALSRAGCLGSRPVVALGRGWQDVLSSLAVASVLPEPQRSIVHCVLTAEDAVRHLEERLSPGTGERP